MKTRNLKYEQKFKTYLFSFDFETHKDICKNLNVNHKQGEVTRMCRNPSHQVHSDNSPNVHCYNLPTEGEVQQ